MENGAVRPRSEAALDCRPCVQNGSKKMLAVPNQKCREKKKKKMKKEKGKKEKETNKIDNALFRGLKQSCKKTHPAERCFRFMLFIPSNTCSGLNGTLPDSTGTSVERRDVTATLADSHRISHPRASSSAGFTDTILKQATLTARHVSPFTRSMLNTTKEQGNRQEKENRTRKRGGEKKKRKEERKKKKNALAVETQNSGRTGGPSPPPQPTPLVRPFGCTGHPSTRSRLSFSLEGSSEWAGVWLAEISNSDCTPTGAIRANPRGGSALHIIIYGA
ncbi:hypothetical protein D8B26_000662 [Coccidioides posadasii str. Silveira]|uniref:uncharacterized protein n=1 Tax=Coccidioides posadasii (strain RMSCC 757 / Silveira) TaxID=443226 RepID=UPI001BF03D02|nr:hypothetical protein D8B26_000662 [Coccidioides posadasii str. Silveira]